MSIELAMRSYWSASSRRDDDKGRSDSCRSVTLFDSFLPFLSESVLISDVGFATGVMMAGELDVAP